GVTCGANVISQKIRVTENIIWSLRKYAETCIIKTLYIRYVNIHKLGEKMTRNITVGISDELLKRMDELTDVNWSAVTRDCIEQYIKQRTVGNLEPIIAKVKQKRGEEFKKGYEFVIKNVENLGLPELEEIAYPDEDKEKYSVRLYHLLYHRPLQTRMLIEKLLTLTENEFGEVTDVKFIVSSEFLKGMQEAAKEIVEKSK
ncbi:hypothetical protein, partial [Candidatus Methanoperedens nitratireducens]